MNATSTMLVVDDDEATCRSLADVLIAKGYEADKAYTAAEALDLVARNAYDVIVLDLQLPDLRGQDLMPRIEDLSPETEIIVITGHASLENAMQSVSHSTVGYLLKPLDLDRLLRIVERVTERRRAVQELAHYRKNLEEMVAERTRELEESRERLLVAERLASVGTLAAGIAHQINNPVGSILAAAEYALLVESDPDAIEVWKSSYQTIVDEARRCGEIVRSVLQFARNEKTAKWKVDLNEVVQRSCRAAGAYAEESRADVKFAPSATPAHVILSPIEFEQVIINVLRNAIESRPYGASVNVGVEQDSRYVRTRVGDNGIGMDKHEIRRIFDPFYTRRVEQGGTGLGLSVAHGIVVDHDGTISVASEKSVGTTVTIELPRAD